jgi:hypothetical protein
MYLNSKTGEKGRKKEKQGERERKIEKNLKK